MWEVRPKGLLVIPRGPLELGSLEPCSHDTRSAVIALQRVRGITYRLENSRLAAAMSWDGEPAPDRGAPDILLEGARPGERPKGDRTAPADWGSLGDVLVGDPERF